MKKLLVIVCLLSAGMFAANAQCTHAKKTAEVESAKTINSETPAASAVLAADKVEGAEAKKSCTEAEKKNCTKAEKKSCSEAKASAAEAKTVSLDAADGEKKSCAKTCTKGEKKACTKKDGDVKTTEATEDNSSVKFTSVTSAEPADK